MARPYMITPLFDPVETILHYGYYLGQLAHTHVHSGTVMRLTPNKLSLAVRALNFLNAAT
jgi:hypothetical protein